MRAGKRIGVIIPALDEEASIGKVIAAIPDWADRIVVVDNGSRDATGAVAAAAGALVVSEPERGYGAACLAGMAAVHDLDVVVFIDGDYSDHPEEMSALVDPILAGECQFVVGSRVLKELPAGAFTPQQRFGNWLACALMRLIWGVRFTDLGPFRAIERHSLERLGMRDRTYGWTVEMQIRAAVAGLVMREEAVSYRRRIGRSKISGTVKGTVLAGYKILATIGRFAWQTRDLPRRRPT